jgi:hypothetical protein
VLLLLLLAHHIVAIGSLHCLCCCWFITFLMLLVVCRFINVVCVSCYWCCCWCITLFGVTLGGSHYHFHIGSLCCWCCSWDIILLMLLRVHCIFNVVGVIAIVLHCCTPFATKYKPSPFPPSIISVAFNLSCC